MKLQEIAHKSATELRHLIAERELSPVQVVKACLNQIGRWNGDVNAVVTLSPEVLDDARRAEQKIMAGEKLGPLHGLPVGIKDMTPVAGMRTTFGSSVYADHVAEEDALIVKRLKQSGAIILGKTNTSEFAAGANTFNEVFGPTRNPWNLRLTPGGSTGGGAAGLATGMFALGEGTDLGGSLRIPAAFCGVVGLRPTTGLVPTHPSDYLWDSLSVTGPMARRVEDIALMLQVISGPSLESVLAQPVEGRDFVAAVEGNLESGLAVAYSPDLSGIGIDSEIEKCCRRAANDLNSAGLRVDEVEVDLSFSRKAFLALRGQWMLSHHLGRLEHLDSFGPNLAGNIRAGLELKSYDLAAAEQVRTTIWHQLRRFFQRYDLLLTPTTAVAPFPVEAAYPEIVAGRKMETYIDWAAPTFVLSVSGLPVASVPCGKDWRGLPVGIQIAGPPRSEERILRVARVIQEANPIGRP